MLYERENCSMLCWMSEGRLVCYVVWETEDLVAMLFERGKGWLLCCMREGRIVCCVRKGIVGCYVV